MGNSLLYIKVRVSPPMTLSECLKEAIVKFTNLDPSTLESEGVLKDTTLMQSSPDIRRKLQKCRAGKFSLDQLAQAASTLYYNQDLNKGRQENRCHSEITAAMSVHTSARNTEVLQWLWKSRSSLKAVSIVQRPKAATRNMP